MTAVTVPTTAPITPRVTDSTVNEIIRQLDPFSLRRSLQLINGGIIIDNDVELKAPIKDTTRPNSGIKTAKIKVNITSNERKKYCFQRSSSLMLKVSETISVTGLS